MYHTIVYHRKTQSFTVDRGMKNGKIRSASYTPNKTHTYRVFAMLGRMNLNWAENKKIVIVSPKHSK